MDYRIKHVEKLGYFGQVKIGMDWDTIGRHSVGFGLYDADHYDYPLDTKKEAKDLCKDYDNWVTNKNMGISYTRITV